MVRWLGAYSPTQTYNPGDLVTSAGSPYLYIWTPAHPGDEPPLTAPTPPNATYWLAL